MIAACLCFCFLSCFWYFWIRRLCLGAFQKLLSIGFSVLCTSEVTPSNYLPIFYNISQTVRPFLFFKLSALHRSVKLFLSVCKESANLGKEIHSQVWWGGEWGIFREGPDFTFFLQLCQILPEMRNVASSRRRWWYVPPVWNHDMHHADDMYYEDDDMYQEDDDMYHSVAWWHDGEASAQSLACSLIPSASFSR